MTKVLQPNGPFLFITWDPFYARISVNGTLENKDLAFDMLKRAKIALEEHYDEIAKENMVRRQKVTLTDAN